MITLTHEQARLVLAALDVTVRANGLQTAPAIFELAVEIQKQIEQNKPTPEP